MGNDMKHAKLGAASAAVAVWLGLQGYAIAGALPEPAQMTVAPVVRLVAPGVVLVEP